MSRKPKALIDSITDQEQLIDAILQHFADAYRHTCSAEYLPILVADKRWLARAMVERDFSILRELALGFRDIDCDVFRSVTGVRLPKGKGKKPYAMIREWCGLSPAWQEHDDAKRALSIEYEKLFVRYGAHTEPMVEGLQLIWDEGWTEIRQLTDQAGRTYEGLFRPGSTSEYHPLSGPDLKKESLLAVAGKYWKALMRLRLAEGVLAAEVDKQRRVEICQRVVASADVSGFSLFL